MFVFVVAALCLAVAEIASAQEKFNLLKPRNTNAPPPRIQRQVENRTNPLITGLQNAGDPEKREAGRYGTMYYVLFFSVLTVLIAGIVYWRVWQQKRMDWALNDPMALVEELSFVHQLSKQEQRLMLEISNRNALPSPLQLFVEPKFLLEAWEDESFVSTQPVVRRLLSKLFDITTEEGKNTTMLTGMNSAGMNSATQVHSQTM